MMGEMLHYYLIIIKNYLITEMCTRSHRTQPKLHIIENNIIEKSDSECRANTLYICEHNQSNPNEHTLTSYIPHSGVMNK